MSRKIIDLSLGNAPTLDLSVFYPRIYAHTEDAPGSLPPFTDISREREAVIDCGEEYFVKIDPFRTPFTLDLARPGVIHIPFWKMWFGERPRLRTINLTPKLSIPYGAVDIREMEERSSSSTHTHPDIFRRSLPWNLQITHFIRVHTRLWKRIGIGLALIALTLILLGIPFLNYLKHSFLDAEMRLIRISQATSNEAIKDDILAVRATFERANIFLKPVFLLFDNPIIHFDRIESTHALVDAGLATTRALDSVVRTLPPHFTHTPKTDTGTVAEESLTPDYRAPARDILLFERFGILSPTQWYKENTPAVQTAIEELEKTSQLLERFTTTGDEKRDRRIIDMRDTLSHLARYGRFFLEHEKEMLRMLGDTEPMKYIIFNQNRDEIRANGGFPGTVFTFTLYKGNILDYRKDDVYYYDWNLFPNVEAPPLGLEQFGNFGLRDVTYYPLFRESLEKANSFIEKSGETSVTNGIAINQGLIEDILAVTGPVTLSGIAEPFTEKNFSSLMSTLVEAKYAKVKTPKDVLFEFVDTLEKKIFSEGKIAPVLSILEKNLREGQIIIRSRDDATDRFLLSFGIFDSFIADMNNWVYPIFTNVGGNKSDRYVTRSYDRTTTLLSGCTVENILTIRSTHSFSGQEEGTITRYMDMLGITDKALRQKLLTIEGKGVNRAFVRIVTPFGSRLTGENEDIKIDTSRFDSTTFSFSLITPVGGASEKTLHYISKPVHCIATGAIYPQPGLRIEDSSSKIAGDIET